MGGCCPLLNLSAESRRKGSATDKQRGEAECIRRGQGGQRDCVCVLLLWLSRLTVSHVAWDPHRTLPSGTDVCRGQRLAGRVVRNAPDPSTTQQLASSQDRQAGRQGQADSARSTSSRSWQARDTAADFNSLAPQTSQDRNKATGACWSRAGGQCR